MESRAPFIVKREKTVKETGLRVRGIWISGSTDSFILLRGFMPQTDGRTEIALVNTSRIRIWASIVSEIRAFGKLPFVFHSRMPPRHVYVDRVAIVLVFPVMVRESWVPPVKMGTRNEGEEETRSRFRLRGWSTNTYRV